MKNSTYNRRKNTVSTWKKSTARMVLAWLARNALQLCPDRAGARVDARLLEDLLHRRRRQLVSQAGRLAVDAPVPQPGLSRAISSASARTACAARGRPGARRE
jgi:hypothetical protein